MRDYLAIWLINIVLRFIASRDFAKAFVGIFDSGKSCMDIGWRMYKHSEGGE